MDQKSWPWRKKSGEKTSFSTDKVPVSPKRYEKEKHILPTDKEELEKELKSLTDKFSSALSECNAKDDILRRHANIAQKYTEGWEKAETESRSLKQELNEALRQRAAGDIRLTNVDAALKECMHQLRSVREEQEQRVHDAVMKTSREFEKSHMVLEDKLEETSRFLAKVGFENTHLSEVVLVKEQQIQELNRQITQTEADFKALITRLETTEKENSSLSYEVRVLQKELEIRNEEIELIRQTADASHKQHVENVKKIAKLDSECQRLCLQVQKRLPGPAALAKMKKDIGILGRDSVEMRRKRLNGNPNGLLIDFSHDNSPDTLTERIHFLTKMLCSMEEENRNLKDSLNEKTNELQLSRIMYASIASKPSEVDWRLEELSIGDTITHSPTSDLMSRDLSLASISKIGSQDKFSYAESWASSVITELDHFTNKKQKGSPQGKTVRESDINLMHDFVEMEKLALVSFDKPSASSCCTSVEATATLGLSRCQLSDSSRIFDREVVSSSGFQPAVNVVNQKIKAKDSLIGKVPSWLQDILKVISEQNRISQRAPNEILEYIRVGLAYVNHPNSGEFAGPWESSKHPDESNKSFWMGLPNKVNDVDMSLVEKINEKFHTELSKSISKIIELIDGINLPSLGYDSPETLSRKEAFSSYHNETPEGYMVRVFYWKITEIGAVLQEFVHTCYDLLNGKADLNKFCQELAYTLNWIVNHCFSIQDVSSMRDAIKKHFNVDEFHNETEGEAGLTSQFSEADNLCVPSGQFSNPLASVTYGQYNVSQMGDVESKVIEDAKFNNELVSIESAKENMGRRLHSAIGKNESLVNQLQESESTIANLKMEIHILSESKGMLENQIENQRLTIQDLDAQLTVAIVELEESRHKFSSLEMELENKSICCEELESTCLELQLQLESLTKEKMRSSDFNQQEEKLRTDMEITAASEKLAECQDTILNLGKQLKAMASPREAALYDKVICIPTDSISSTTTTTTMAIVPAPPNRKNMNRRSSLLDRMLEDDSLAKDPENRVKGIRNIVNLQEFSEKAAQNGSATAVGSLAILPSKKHGYRSLWKKLLWRERSHAKKSSPPISLKDHHKC